MLKNRTNNMEFEIDLAALDQDLPNATIEKLLIKWFVYIN